MSLKKLTDIITSESENDYFHDSTLTSINVIWLKRDDGEVLINISGCHLVSYSDYVIVAKNFTKILVPKKEEWGPSTQILHTDGPTKLDGNTYLLVIQMQSGDQIEIEAESFWFTVT
jgi:hypothetical protein